MPAPDLETLEGALTTRLLAIVNTTLTPTEPLLRSAFNLIDEALSNDNTPRRLPGVGIMHEGEPWEENELLGGLVSQQLREQWKLFVLCDSPARDGGIRGKRGAYTVTKLIIEDIDGWQIIDGCPIRIDARRRFAPRDENGELTPTSGYIIDISHPATYAN